MKYDVKFPELNQSFNARFGEVQTIHGKDGITPHIGENGNWFIGDEDTGVKAQGYTPQKGVDYFTEAEISEIAQHLAEGTVLYTPQTLADEQKAQARDNIGSVGVEEFNALKADIETALDNIISIQNKLIGGESV